MISNFLWPKMGDMDTDRIWFQQDGATRLARWQRELAIKIVRFNTFGFFPWGYLRPKVYINKFQTIDTHKVNKRHPPNSAKFMQKSNG